MTTIDLEPPESPAGQVRLSDLWFIGSRHKWVVISSILVSLAAAGIYCTVAPKSYRSETLLAVEERQIPESYVQGVAEGNVEQRIFLIQRQMRSQTLLGKIVKDFNLYPKVLASKGWAFVIAKVASDIKVELFGKKPQANFVPHNSVEAFTVSFAHEDPEVAMQVAGAVAGQFILENSKARAETAEGTTEFIDLEAQDAHRALEQQDNEIRRFKAEHIGELPEQMEPNLRALDRLQNDLISINDSIHRLSDRLAALGKSVQEYKQLGGETAAPSGGRAGTNRVLALKDARERHAKLSAEFTENYPDVVVAKEEIARLEKQLVEPSRPGAIAPGGTPPDTYFEDLKRQEDEANAEMISLKGRREALHIEKHDYEKRVAAGPAVEQELQILMRHYDNLKNNYRSLLDKQLNARISENLEKQQKGSQFRVVDPANLPLAPEKPNRALIMILSLAFGCVSGMGIALMKERRNPQFHRVEEIKSLSSLPLLSAIPDFTVANTTSGRLRRRPGAKQIQGKGRPLDGHGRLLITHDKRAGSSAKAPSPDANFIAKSEPLSMAAEQYRIAASRLALSRPKEPSTILAVTSAVKGEGKTTTVINLGYTLARDLGKRTLLMDCDFRSPMLHRYIATSSAPGLADCLFRKMDTEMALHGLGDVPCWIMPVGNSVNPSNDLLKADRLARIFAQLREQFEYILINTPPILALADMNVLAAQADVVVLVIRANDTPQDAVKRSLERLVTDAQVHLLLNRVSPRSQLYHTYCGYPGESSDCNGYS